MISNSMLIQIDFLFQLLSNYQIIVLLTLSSFGVDVYRELIFLLWAEFHFVDDREQIKEGYYSSSCNFKIHEVMLKYEDVCAECIHKSNIG